MRLELGILIALACAATTNLAFLYKYRGANTAALVEVSRPLRSARALFASKWFALGMLVGLGGWLLHVGALALAPISVVQAVLAGGVVLLAVMAERLFGFSVGARQWWGVGLTAAGLVLLGLSLPTTHGAHSSFSLAAMIAFEGGMIVLGALLVVGRHIGAPDGRHGVMLGAASGILFGVSDIAIKALSGLVGGGGVLALVSPWMAIAALASVGAFYASARGLQDGQAVPVITITSAAATVTGIAGGILVFGDPLSGNALGLIAQLAAFVLVCLAAWLTPGPMRAAAHG